MLAFLADENFHGDIIRGILRENPAFDLVRVQDVGLSGHPDPDVLRWAAEQGRIVFTHDLASMPYYGEQRVTEGHPGQTKGGRQRGHSDYQQNPKKTGGIRLDLGMSRKSLPRLQFPCFACWQKIFKKM